MLLLPMSGCASPSAKAPKAHRFTTALYCELADLEADEYDEMKSGFGPAASDPPQYRRGRSCIFHNLVPAGTGIQTLVSVEGRGWAIETASRPPRTSLASITTKPGHVMAGIATSRS